MAINKKTGMGYMNLRTKKQKDDLFVRVSNFLWPYIIGVLAVYGFMDILLRANGM